MKYRIVLMLLPVILSCSNDNRLIGDDIYIDEAATNNGDKLKYLMYSTDLERRSKACAYPNNLLNLEQLD